MQSLTERRSTRRFCRRRLGLLFGALLLPVLLLTTRHPARANGRFPQGSQLVFDPADPRHIALTTTFGFLDSRDGGAHFAWKCESALGLGGETDMMLAIPASGETVLATFNGVFITSDGCSFDAPAELVGKIVPDLTLSASEPHRLFAFRMLGAGDGRFDSEVLRSEDSGRSWSPASTLPLELLPLTIDVAPSDPNRVYLSARQGSAFDFSSVLLRSDDGGVSFQRSPIPETSGQRMGYIAGVHPHDPNLLFVRVDDPGGTVIWQSEDAGATFSRSFVGQGRLPGFAFSPDARSVALGGPSDGIWVGAREGADWARRSDVGATCLGWSAEGLYACADAATAGFSLGVSRDGGIAFEALFSFNQLCGTASSAATSSAGVSCPADTPIAMLCPAEWQLIAPALAPACLTEDAGVGPDANESSPADRATTRSNGCALSAPARRAQSRSALCMLALLGLVLGRASSRAFYRRPRRAPRARARGACGCRRTWGGRGVARCVARARSGVSRRHGCDAR